MNSKSKTILFGGLLAGALFLFTSTVVEGACNEDALANVSGGTLVMSSGAVYQVGNPGIAIAFWLPLAKVTICDRMNLNGESYIAISNKDASETVRAARVVN